MRVKKERFSLLIIFIIVIQNILLNILFGKVEITGFLPSQGCVGDTVTIYGSGFGSTQGTGYVKFGDVVVSSVISWNDTQIQAVFPSGGEGPIGVYRFSPIKYNLVGAYSSSTQGGNLPTFVIDNNPGTRWESQFSDPQWLVVDIGYITNITRVIIEWEPAYSKRFTIQVSTNEMDWTTVSSNINPAGMPSHWRQIIDFSNVKARYVRMYSYERITGWGNSIFEFEVYFADDDTTSSNFIIPRPNITSFNPTKGYVGTLVSIDGDGFGDMQGTGYITVGGVNAAIISWNNKNVIISIPAGGDGGITLVNTCGFSDTTAIDFIVSNYNLIGAVSSSTAQSPLNAIDNNSGSRWESIAADDQWIYVDLGSVKPVNRTIIEWEAAYSATYAIQVSTNAVDWVTVDSNTNPGGMPNHWKQTNNFPTINARYVRMYGYTRATPWGHSIFEMDVQYSLGLNFTLLIPPSPVKLISPQSNLITTNTSFDFKWSSTTGKTDIDYYILEISTNTSFSSPTVYQIESTNTNLTLGEGHWYWRVRAVDVLGAEGTNSNIWPLFIDINPPQILSMSPTNLEVVTDTNVNFSWSVIDNGIGISNVQVECSSNNFVSIYFSKTYLTGTGNFTTNLNYGNWSWRIIAKDKVNKTVSKTNKFSLIDTVPPSKPILSLPINNFITNDSNINFVWYSVYDLSGISGYRLQIDDNQNFATLLTNILITGTNVNLSLPQGKWYWRVRVIDNANNFSEWSATNIVTVDTTPPLVTRLSPVSNALRNKLKVYFEWNVTDNLSSVKSNWLLIDLDKDFDADVVIGLSNSITGTNYNFSGNGTNYWAVRAIDYANNQITTSWLPIIINTNIKVEITKINVNDGIRVIENIKDPVKLANNSGKIEIIIFLNEIVPINSVNLIYRIGVDPTETVYDGKVMAVKEDNHWKVEIPYSIIKNIEGDFCFKLEIDGALISKDISGNGWRIILNSIKEQKDNITVLNNVAKYKESKNIFIKYEVKENTEVDISIYNINGELVKNLVKDTKSNGIYLTEWDCKDNSGRFVGRGVYFMVIKMGDKVKSVKNIMIK